MVSKFAVAAGTAVISFAVGAYVGYKYTERRLGIEFEDLLAHEAEQLKEYYSRANKTGIFESPDTAAAHLIPKDSEDFTKDVSVETLQRVVKGLKYVGVDSPEELNPEEDEVFGDEDELIREKANVNHQRVNIFDRTVVPPVDFDYSDEIAARDPEFPYIVSYEEFQEGDLAEATLSYFEGDNKLVNGSIELIDEDEVDGFVGKENLKRFGHRSNDDNMVYIRNERLGYDFEIIRSRGTYAKEVLGIDEDATVS